MRALSKHFRGELPDDDEYKLELRDGTRLRINQTTIPCTVEVQNPGERGEWRTVHGGRRTAKRAIDLAGISEKEHEAGRVRDIIDGRSIIEGVH